MFIIDHTFYSRNLKIYQIWLNPLYKTELIYDMQYELIYSTSILVKQSNKHDKLTTASIRLVIVIFDHQMLSPGKEHTR